MTAYQEYLDGTLVAKLERGRMITEWENDDAYDFVNKLFKFYYDARNRIEECSNHDHRMTMLEELKDVSEAGTGWPWNVNHLDDAFKHIAKNYGSWYDEDFAAYDGNREKIYKKQVKKAPVSIVNFANAIDDRMKKLRSVFRDKYDLPSYELVCILEKTNMDSRGFEHNPQKLIRIGDLLGDMKKASKKAKPFLWMAPTIGEEELEYLGKNPHRNRMLRKLGKKLNFVYVVKKIELGLSIYDTYKKWNGSGKDVAIAASAVKFAISWVPVLGGFYAKAWDMIPGLKEWFEGIVRDRCERIDRIFKEHVYIKSRTG